MPQTQKPKFLVAAGAVVLFIVLMFYFIVALDAPPHIPMLLGCVITAVAALLSGSRWQQIEEGMVEGISQALVSVIILMLIGVLIGVWIWSGVVPAMIYYGLKLLSPALFLPSAMVICALVSMALGSWGTAGTLGIALMGIAQIMGIPAPIAAGAVISGSYMGDKVSPLSDSTNLASAVTGVDIFKNVGHMLPISGTAFGIAAVLFTVLGRGYGGQGAGADVSALSATIRNTFAISPLNFLPLVLLVVCIAFKIPSIAGITFGILSAAVLGALVQGGGMEQIVTAAFSGYTCQSGSEVLDKLLTAGGLSSMMYSISLILCAMMFAGIMEKTGIMAAFMEPFMRHIRSGGMLITATVLSCMAVNVVLPEQYVAIAVPGRMYLSEYDKRGIPRTELTRALGAGGAAFSPVVPWNTCGAYMSGVLGVATAAYAPYAFLNLIIPVVAIVAGFFTCRRKHFAPPEQEDAQTPVT